MGKVRWAIAALAISCGSDLDRDGAGENASIGGSTAGDLPGNGSDFSAGGAGAAGGGGALPPEIELSEDFERPQAGQSYVYAANPETDNVAVINASTLSIHIVEAGDEPTFLQTLAGRDAAIVLNVGSADATIIRTENGTSAATKVRVHAGSNAIRVSPDGRFAIVYYDPSYSSAGDRQGSFQDVTVIALEEGNDVAYPTTVGFRPSAIFFQSDGSRAFAVTEDGVSILDFQELASGGPGIARTVPIGSVGIDPTLDVSVTPDGRYALAREEGSAVLRLVDLDASGAPPRTLDLSTLAPRESSDGGAPPAPDAGSLGADAGGAIIDGATDPDGSDGAGMLVEAGDGDAGVEGGVALLSMPPAGGPFDPLPLVVTDLDLAPSGDQAIAILRDASLMLRIPIPGAFDDPSSVQADVIEGELVGSVTLSPDGVRALLYTTAVPTNERLTIFDLAASTYRTVQLRKSVRSVAIAPGGDKALVLHQKIAGAADEAAIDLDTQIDRSYGYSLLELSTGFAKLEVTPVDLGPFALTPDGSTLFLLFDDESLREVQRANLSSFFVDHFTLGSPPVSVGAVPGSQRVFVGQEHPDGRIAFIDWVTGDVQSVTGFELNSQIRE